MKKRKMTGPPSGMCLTKIELNELSRYADILQATDSLTAERREHIDLCESCQNNLRDIFPWR